MKSIWKLVIAKLKLEQLVRQCDNDKKNIHFFDRKHFDFQRMLLVILDTNFFFCDKITYYLATQKKFSFVREPGKKNFNSDFEKMVHNFWLKCFLSQIQPKT
jgi:hypothetical protein